MGITILQLNIRNWNRLKFTLNLEIHKHSPDIILLNETGKAETHNLKIQGYQGFGKNNVENHGIAIFIRNNTYRYEQIILKDEGVAAIKIKSTMGDIIIGTAYCPPREKNLPTISLNKIFSYNCPTLFIGDLNSHHEHFHNLGKRKYPDIKGKQAFNLINNRNLNYLGPNFNTYYGMRNKGTPDIIIGNNKLIPFNYQIIQGSNIGSDHIPIIMKLQIKPFVIVHESCPNKNTLNLTKYRDTLKQLPALCKHVQLYLHCFKLHVLLFL